MGTKRVAADIYAGVDLTRERTAADRYPETIGYQGEDRRGLVTDDRAVPRRWFPVAVLVSLAITVLLAATSHVTVADGIDVALLGAQLDGAGLALASALAALCFVRWRLVGEAAVAWMGTAAVLYGGFTIGLDRVLAASGRSMDATVVALVPGTARIVAFGAIAAALLAPEVDANLRPARLAAVSTTVAVALAAASSQVPALVLSPTVLAAAWAVLGVAGLTKGFRTRRHLLVWCGLAFLMFAVAKLATIQSDAGSVGAAAPALFRIFGLIWAVTGATSGLARAYRRQGGRLLASLTAEHTAAAKMRAERETQCVRAHEARNAMATIQAAAMALRYSGAGDDAGRTALTEGLASELRRLAELVDPTADETGTRPFDLGDLVADVAASARLQGTAVSIDHTDGLIALGHVGRTAQVLHNLLQNARRYAGGPVVIRTCAEGADVVIRVIDDGPGVPAVDRQAVFDRGVRGSTSAGTVGDGLGLFIGSQLMSEQGGELRLEEPPGGGACFAAVLPIGES
jgi:signal transduction histidine kinase